MTQQESEEFYSRLQAQNPEPKGELDWVNPFTLLVAVVLAIGWVVDVAARRRPSLLPPS